MRNRIPLLAAALLAFLFGVNCYRAATQSLTIDEAFTFHRYLDQPLAAIFTQFDANNHVLYSLLGKALTSLWGQSEFVIRLVSLQGGIVYLVTVYRVCRLLFGGRWLFLLAVALLSLNPLMLDYLSAARGYGLATALVLAALDQLLRYLREPGQTFRLYWASIALSLAVGANLTALWPGLALVTSFAVLHLGQAGLSRNWQRLRQRAANLIDHLAVPGVVLTLSIVLFPFLKAERKDFYVGAEDLPASLSSIWFAAMWRDGNHWPPEWQQPLLQFFETAGYAMLPLVIVCCAALLVIAIRRREGPGALLIPATLLLTLAVLFAANHVFGILYPYRRTGLYLLPLASLTLMLVVLQAGRFAPIASIIPLACVFEFLAGWNLHFYDEWAFDASNRQMAKIVRALPRPAGRKARLRANWQCMQSWRYYIKRYRLDWVELVDGREATGSFDVFVLLSEDAPLLAKHNLRTLLQEPVSGARLAIPSPDQSQ